MSRTTFMGFDMSRLSNPVPLDLTEAVAVKEIDIIDKHISAMELDRHPEVLKDILVEFQIYKFWNELLLTPDTYSVFYPLAVNRMLNFYEGAVKGGLKHADIRIGLVVCMVTSTALVAKNKGTDAYVAMGAFNFCPLPRSGCRISVENLKSMSSEDIKAAVTMVNCFAKGMATAEKLGRDRLGEYLINAFRMWIVSDDKDVIDINSNPMCREAFLSEQGQENEMLRLALIAGGIHAYSHSLASQYTTPWARSKSIKLNAVSRFARIRAA